MERPIGNGRTEAPEIGLRGVSLKVHPEWMKKSGTAEELLFRLFVRWRETGEIFYFYP